jgi:hypothetical protein
MSNAGSIRKIEKKFESICNVAKSREVGPQIWLSIISWRIARPAIAVGILCDSLAIVDFR